MGVVPPGMTCRCRLRTGARAGVADEANELPDGDGVTWASGESRRSCARTRWTQADRRSDGR